MPIVATLRSQVAQRDGNRCAYCLTSENNSGLKLHIDHIIPVSHGGPTALDNLCQACFSCNVHKQAHQAGTDQLTGLSAPLFHPLQQRWSDHFVWDQTGASIIGLTPAGRATIMTLQMNNPAIVRARRRWVSAGWHPPTGT